MSMGQHRGTTRIETVRRRTSDDRDGDGAYSGTYDLATYVDGELYGSTSDGVTEDTELGVTRRLADSVAGDVELSRYELLGTGEFFFTFDAFSKDEYETLPALW